MSKWSSAFRDSRWQKLRLEIMERDGWTCKSCGASGKGVTLNVHHAYYESGKAPWEYPADTLVTWCEDCHEKRHSTQKELLVLLSKKTIKCLSDVLEVCKDHDDSLHMLAKLSAYGIADPFIYPVLNAAYEMSVESACQLIERQNKTRRFLT